MHEIIPTAKRVLKSIVSASNAQQLNGTRIKTTFSTPRQTLPLFTGRGQIFPAPRLKISTGSPEYLIINGIEAGGVNSVEQVWTTRAKSRKMLCYVQLICVPTADTPGTTLLLHFDAKRYLLGNIAEGAQRACVQRRIGLGKVSDIFLTGNIRWSSMGGLLGMILTLADQSTVQKHDLNKKQDNTRPWLNVHGGKNLTHALAAARRFIFRKGMPVHTQEFRAHEARELEKSTWEDDCIKVWTMVLDPEGEEAQRPRKRSHEDFSKDDPVLAAGSEELQEDRDDQIRRGVLGDMFNSSWRLDTLVTKKLSEVAMPAKIFVRNSQNKIVPYEGPLFDEQEKVTDIDVLVRNPWPGAMLGKLPPTKISKQAISYIIKGHPQRGKFDPKAAIKLGVKPGPQFRALTMGESVTTPEGKVVTPDQVMGGGKEGAGFAVVDLPDTSFIEALVTRKEWASPKIMNGLGAIFWILGPGCVHSSRLKTFMEEHKELKHIVSSPEACANSLALESPSSQAIRLHLLDGERFPIPAHSNKADVLELGQTCEVARAGKKLLIEPRIELQDENIVPYLDTAEIVKGASSEVKELSDKAKEETTSSVYLDKLAKLQGDIPSKDAEVISLGTGSAMPSKYRNVSATLVRVPGYGTYLFDCGENTLGQMKRVLGKDLPAVLRDLKVIWISHLHADHHLGTSAVIKAWHDETRRDESTQDSKLMVACIPEMIGYLREYSEIEDFGFDRIEPMTTRNTLYEFTPEQTRAFGVTSINSCFVIHCHSALAVAFTLPNGFKIAYSGDCRPSEKFAEIGKGATLLIHEATFDDELVGDAKAKKHSTTSEALEIGSKMGARRILLTHFSQRYQKIPVMKLDENMNQIAIVAFDYMRVKIGDFAKVAAFRPALTKLFEEDMVAEAD